MDPSYSYVVVYLYIKKQKPAGFFPFGFSFLTLFSAFPFLAAHGLTKINKLITITMVKKKVKKKTMVKKTYYL